MKSLYELYKSKLYKIKERIGRSSLRRKRETSSWKMLIKKDRLLWENIQKENNRRYRVLVAPSMGGFQQGVLLESTLAVALTLRGANVDILLCDNALPACQLTEIASVAPETLLLQTPQHRCRTCYPYGKEFITPLGLPVYWYSELVSPEKQEEATQIAMSVPFDEIATFQLYGLAVGEHAQAGALRYFARGDFKSEARAEPILRQYLKSAMLTVYVTQELLRRNKYDVACFNHGLYVPQGLIGEVCRQEGVRVVNWNPAYRKHTFIFSPDDTYHHTMLTEPVSAWENIPWTPELETETLKYLKSRWQGTEDWIWFHDEPEEDLEKILQETGANSSQPWVALLTNVMWDAQLHYQSNAFPNMLAWVLQTIAYFEKRPDLQLLIRVHPAEMRGSVPSRQPLVPEIQRVFPRLPSNVFIIPPESQISTYALAERCNAALIYNTKTGIEVSSMGIPVVVAGEAWIRGKGFSRDASSPEEYIRILGELPFAARLDSQETERARKYAFHFFSRRMIPLPFIVPEENFRFSLGIHSLKQLLPGNFEGLDVICEGILNATPFIYPAEMMLIN